MSDKVETASICDRGDIVSFQDRYDLPDLIRCSIAGCNTAHKKGFNVLLKNGSSARIGHICGKHLLGDDVFMRMQRDLEAKEQTALRKKYISSPSFDPAGAEALLASWEERVRLIRQVLGHLKTISYSAYSELQTACQKLDGRITYEDQDGRTHSHTVQGRRFLADESWDVYFGNARSNVRRINELLAKPDLDDKQLAEITQKASQAIRYLTVAAEVLDDFRAFCTIPNLSGLAKWVGGLSKIEEADGFLEIRVRRAGVWAVPHFATAVDRTLIAKLSPA